MLKLRRIDVLAVVAILVAGATLSLALGADYGLSRDEPGMSQLASATLHSHESGQPPSPIGNELRYSGPSFVALAEWAAMRLALALPQWNLKDARHAAYFQSFVLGAISVYLIGRGHVGSAAAIGGSILFISQPLLFGHGFINPKDMPLLGFFAALMAAGMLSLRLLRVGVGGGEW